jgi:hypothetical protein
MNKPARNNEHHDAIQRGVRARADELKQELFRWVLENSSPADAVPMNIALLEIAMGGHLVITENPKETFDFVTKIFQRVVHKPTGRIH